MPVLTVEKDGLSAFNAAASPTGNPRARIPTFFFDTQGRGTPRFDDLITVRALEQTHTVTIPIDTIKTQISTTDWVIRPTVDNPTSAHEAAAADLTQWLDGRFNQNRDSFDHLVKQWANDLLSMDAGILELVPRDENHPDGGQVLDQVWPRDGATFVKAPQNNGVLPDPETIDPDEDAGDRDGVPAWAAYWQFPLSRQHRPWTQEEPMHEFQEAFERLRFYGHKQHEPIPFPRDHIVWTQESPYTWRPYGLGRVQKAKRIIEIVLNQDITNRKYFTGNEIPEGVLNLVQASQPELNRFREWWQDEVEGREHKLPIVGGREMEWTRFRPELKDLQFLESQEWYNKLIWFLFGLNQAEIGDVSDVNRACYSEDTEVLTEEGWKLHDEVEDGERIAVYDPDTDSVRLEVPGDVHAYEVEEDLLHFETTGQDILVTEDHTMLYRSGRTWTDSEGRERERGWKTADAQELEGRPRMNFLAGAPEWEGEDADVSDTYLRFLGWAISQGGLSTAHREQGKYMMTLAHDKEKTEDLDDIRETLEALDASYTEYGREEEGATRWNVYGKDLIEPLFDEIGAYSEEKRVPRKYLNLPKEKLEQLFDALMRGDGHWDPREDRESGYYSTVSPQLAADVQEIACKLGYGATVTTHYEEHGNKQECYRVLIKEQPDRTVKEPSRVPYSGKVYCFSTSTGFYVTRRNGCVAIQGNTAKEQGHVVWRQTTKPLLDNFAADLNTQVIAKTEPYARVNGELEFAWQPDHPHVKAKERTRQQEDLSHGVRTVNEVRRERGLDDVPWGDWPADLQKSVFRVHPEWALDALDLVDDADIDPPAPTSGGGGGFLAAPSPSVKDGEEPSATLRPATKDPFLSGVSTRSPDFSEHVDTLARRVGNILEQEGEDLVSTIEARLEESELSDLRRQAKQAKQDPSQALPADQVVAEFQVRDLLSEVVTSANRDAMREGAEHHAERLARELEDQVGEDAAEVALGFDIEDTAALEEMEGSAAARMTTVEQTVKERIRDTITRTLDTDEDGFAANLNDVTKALREQITQLSDSHARLVARTETMSSSRQGSQALAETNDAVGGKEWIATLDDRTRAWHAEMHGTVVRVNDSFTVPRVADTAQPQDYPRQAKVVGEDQPYRCRCDQAPVLREDLPEDLRQLAMLEGVTVKGVEPALETAVGPRSKEVLREHALPTETFSMFVQRVEAEPWSRNETASRLGIAKQTWYDWLDAADGVSV